MDAEDRLALHDTRRDVKAILAMTANQERRITVLEHWRTALSSGFAAILGFVGYKSGL